MGESHFLQGKTEIVGKVDVKMNCNIIKDLLPLYVDGCCCEESAKAIEEHIKNCEECRKYLESIKKPIEMKATVSTPMKAVRISEWKASVLQSVLLFLTFAGITAGVTLEAATPSGGGNGFWAVTLIVPLTGFLLSLANWYFVRFYKSKKLFSVCSMFATLGVSVGGYIWSVLHYRADFSESLTDVQSFASLFGFGVLITVLLCVLSKSLSSRYATMIGKE